jgi:flagellar biosynthesis/type III secretory pathway chaperone
VSNLEENIADVLRQMQAALQQLSGLLDDEFEMLATRDPQGITELALQKQHLCETLEQLEKNRAGLLNDPATQDAWERLNEVWSEITNLAADAQKKNTVNGIIADNGRRHTQQIINVLHGNSNELLTYGASGATVDAKNSEKPIARA